MARPLYIAVAGNIGAGKSTLVDFLCRTYGMQPFFEPNDENPYLADFYEDMKSWSFHSQIFFLSRKFKLHQELSSIGGIVIQDRTIYEDAEIFAKALYNSKKMSKRDYETYNDLYKTMCESLRPPDLMIYLKCPIDTLRKRIRERGRKMEQSIPNAYLKLLQGLYEEWITSYDKSDVLTIDTEKLDYLSDMVHRLDVQKRIDQYLERVCTPHIAYNKDYDKSA